MEKKVQRNFLWIALLVLGTIWILARHNQVTPYQTDNGLIFGTVYKVTYQCDQNLKAEIEAELKRFDGSCPLSMTRRPLRASTATRTLCPTHSLPTSSDVAWKSPGRPMVPSISPLPLLPMPGDLGSRRVTSPTLP